MSFRRAGMAVERAEHQRVASLIEREQQYRTREHDRQLAEYEVRDGVYVNFSDSVVEPTEEWLQQGPIRKFTPRQPKGTVRTITTVRRVLTPIFVRMWNAGKLTDEQSSACLWYRSIHERAGLIGRYTGSQMGMPRIGAVSKSPVIAGAIPVTQQEAEARAHYRAVLQGIKPQFVKFFEKVVIDDVALRRATRFARCDNSRAFPIFRAIADTIVRYCEVAEIELVVDQLRGND